MFAFTAAVFWFLSAYGKLPPRQWSPMGIRPRLLTPFIWRGEIFGTNDIVITSAGKRNDEARRIAVNIAKPAKRAAADFEGHSAAAELGQPG